MLIILFIIIITSQWVRLLTLSHSFSKPNALSFSYVFTRGIFATHFLCIYILSQEENIKTFQYLVKIPQICSPRMNMINFFVVVTRWQVA